MHVFLASLFSSLLGIVKPTQHNDTYFLWEISQAVGSHSLNCTAWQLSYVLWRMMVYHCHSAGKTSMTVTSSEVWQYVMNPLEQVTLSHIGVTLSVASALLQCSPARFYWKGLATSEDWRSAALVSPGSSSSLWMINTRTPWLCVVVSNICTL